MRLYISYARADTALVKSQVVAVLRAANHDPWFDHALIPGQSWKQQLEEQIERCDALVYAITPNSVQSQWCQWEYRQAVELGKPILPLMLREAEFPDNLQALNATQWVDFTEGATGMAVAKLASGLAAMSTLNPAQVADIPERPKGKPKQGRTLSPSRNAIVVLVIAFVLIMVIGIAAIFTSDSDTAPASASHYFNIAVNSNDVDVQLENYTQAIELDSQYRDAYYNRGNTYSNIEAYDRAIADYDRAIEIDPGYVNAYYNRGNAYLNSGENEQAIANYDRVIELAPRYVNAYQNRGNAYYNLSDFDNALADYCQLVELGQTTPIFILNRIEELGGCD